MYIFLKDTAISNQDRQERRLKQSISYSSKKRENYDDDDDDDDSL